MSTAAAFARSPSPKKTKDLLTVLPYGQYVQHLNSTILAKNIMEIPSSTQHSAPYTPMARYLSPQTAKTARYSKIERDNSAIKRIIEQENRRPCKYGYAESPVLQRMVNNHNAVRARRNLDIERDNAFVNQRIYNATSEYSPRAKYMQRAPSMIKPHKVIKMGNQYDEIADGYEEFRQFYKSQARYRSVESYLISRYCNKYCLSYKQSKELLHSKGGVRRVIEVEAAKSQVSSRKTEHLTSEKGVGDQIVSVFNECFDEVVSDVILYAPVGDEKTQAWMQRIAAPEHTAASESKGKACEPTATATAEMTAMHYYQRGDLRTALQMDLADLRV